VTFSYLTVGGLAVGGTLGFLWVKSLRLLKDPSLTIVAAVLLPWAAYIGGEALHVSGVVSTVAAGLMLGWHQHEVFSATVRMRGDAFWHVVIFVLEALVFILIGLSLRGVIERLGGIGDALTALAAPVLAIVVAVILSRFAWVFMSDGLKAIFDRLRGRRQSRWLGSSTVMSWAGMRGVVTLAIALSLPEAMPGRDLILAAAFAVILVTVIGQGATIGPLIRLLHLQAMPSEDAPPLRHEHAMARMAAAQLAVVERLSRQPDGSQKHPRLLEQYGYKVRDGAQQSRGRAVGRRPQGAFRRGPRSHRGGACGDLEAAPIGDDPRRSAAHLGIRPRPAGACGASCAGVKDARSRPLDGGPSGDYARLCQTIS
jgi:monovalent cation/hydrogen antiporter